MALLSLLAVLPAQSVLAQRAGRDTTGRATTGADGSVSVAARHRGLVGISVSGVPTFGSDGTIRFADFPHIAEIVPGSPAALAGLLAGDVILKENDRDARQGQLFVADTSGIAFRVRVKRGEELLEFTLVSVMRSALRPVPKE